MLLGEYPECFPKWGKEDEDFKEGFEFGEYLIPRMYFQKCRNQIVKFKEGMGSGGSWRTPNMYISISPSP